MSKPPDPASNAPGSRSRASSRQPSKEDLRDALKEADDERKELRIRLEIQEKQIAQLMQLLPKPTPQVEPEKPSTDEPKGAPSSSNVGPYAETPPLIKPVVVEQLATPASPVTRRRSLYRHSLSSRRLAIIQLRPAAPLKAVLSRALTLLRSFCNLKRRGSRTRSTGVTQKSELSSGTRNSRSSWLNCCSGMKWLSPKSALP